VEPFNHLPVLTKFAPKNYFLFFIRFYLTMGLQPFVGPWPFFQFLNVYTVGRTPWTGDRPVAKPLHTHRTTQTE
jgi:hypothetical protein